MDPTRPETDRKRKAEDDVHEELSKRPLIDQEKETQDEQQTRTNDEQQPENETYYEATTENTVAAEDVNNKDEEYEPTAFVKKEEEEEYDPTSYSNEEPEVKEEEEAAPLETVVPFDRLIILHLEATCDENPTNPAAVQVTKENSEVIGTLLIEYFDLFRAHQLTFYLYICRAFFCCIKCFEYGSTSQATNLC
jgi:hypothetical protein